MTREEARKLMGESATDEQINAILNKFHEEQGTLKAQVTDLTGKIDTLSSQNTDLLSYKSKYEEIEKAKMSEQEKLELERQEVAKMKKDYAKSLNSIKAKSILVGAGIDDKEADQLVATIVKDDEQTTIASATLLANQFNSLRESTTKKTKEELSNLNIKPAPSNIPPDSTGVASNWEEFSKLSNEEQQKFIKDHPNEFNKF